MDSQRFDDFTRSLSSGSSRRTLLRGMLGSAAALAGLRTATTSAAPQDKVDICHRTGNGSFHHISVNANALDAHVAHGDLVGCDRGFALNTDTCTCEPVANTCKKAGEPCDTGSQGKCWKDVSGDLVCI